MAKKEGHAKGQAKKEAKGLRPRGICYRKLRCNANALSSSHCFFFFFLRFPRQQQLLTPSLYVYNTVLNVEKYTEKKKMEPRRVKYDRCQAKVLLLQSSLKVTDRRVRREKEGREKKTKALMWQSVRRFQRLKCAILISQSSRGFQPFQLVCCFFFFNYYFSVSGFFNFKVKKNNIFVLKLYSFYFFLILI